MLFSTAEVRLFIDPNSIFSQSVFDSKRDKYFKEKRKNYLGKDMRIVVIDSHNEVLPYWFKEYLRLKHPLVEVRIDKHHDMDDECPALPATEGRQIFK